MTESGYPEAEACDEIATDARFAIVPEWVVDNDNLSDRAVRLYAVLGRYADADGRCWPSRSTLAARLRCSLDSVDRAVADLVRVGALTVTKRTGDDGSPQSNLYVLRRLAPRGGSRTGAARGSRTGAAGVAARVRHEREPVEREPVTPIASDLDCVSAGPPVEGLSWTPSAVSVSSGYLPAAVDLCERFAVDLRARGVRVPDGRPRSKAWVEPMEALLRIDGRTPEQVERVCAWLAAGRDRVSHFWQANVLSPAKLRERWDQMAQQYQRETGPRPSRSAAVAHSAGTGRSLASILSDTPAGTLAAPTPTTPAALEA